MPLALLLLDSASTVEPAGHVQSASVKPLATSHDGQPAPIKPRRHGPQAPTLSAVVYVLTAHEPHTRSTDALPAETW